ncbi:hypothetical protein LRP88_01883 [Fusarium phalaenopsidis]
MTEADILKGKYPAKTHARRVVDYIRTKIPHADGFLFLTGSPEKFYDDTDLVIPFRQRRAFMYLTGVGVPDCHLIYEIGNERSALFIPPVDPESILWSGMPLTAEEVLGKYDVDAVLPNTDLQTTLNSIGISKYEAGSAFFTIAGHVGNGVNIPGGMSVDSTSLKEAIDECRVVKDEYEIALIKKANIISSAAHIAVIKCVKQCKNESEIDDVFPGECTKRGTKIQAYPSIVASGRTAATMHYESNNQDLYLDGKVKDVVVIDAGAEWNCYGADIIHFGPHMIRPYLNDQRLSQYIDEEVLDKYWDVCGVCIEDDLVVTLDGSVNLTDVPKDPDELEAIMSNTSLTT